MTLTRHPDSAPCPGALLVCVATATEKRLFPKGAANSRVVQCGVGGDLAARLNSHLAARPSGLLSFGFAAGLAPGAAPGTLLLPRCIRGADQQRLLVTAGWQARLKAALADRFPMVGGDLLEVGEVVRTPVRKRALHADTGADAADMESAALWRLASRHAIPFVALRAVLDAADDALPARITSLVQPGGNLDPGALLLTLLSTPVPLLVLARNYRAAARSLSGAAQLLLPDLLHAAATQTD